MKKDIHPKYSKIKVRLTDGTEYETRSTLGAKEDFVLQLEIDPTCHPAYTGEHRVLDSDQVTKHKKKYGDLVY